MKKVFAAAAALVLCTGLLAGCGEKSSGERIDGGLADSLPIDLEFSSGAGAWGTGLTLAADGSFSGEYHDSDMGDSGDDYPDGTVYLCNFPGSLRISSSWTTTAIP